MSLANANILTAHSVGHHKNSFSRFVHTSENHPMYAPVPVPTTASADSRPTSYTTALNTTTPTCTTTCKDSAAQRLDHHFFDHHSSRHTRQQPETPASAPMVVAHIASAVTGTFVTTTPQNGIHIPFPAVKINTAVAKSVIASSTTATKVHVRVGTLPKSSDEDPRQEEPTCGYTDLSASGVSSGAEESEVDIRHVLAERFKTKPCRNYEEKGVCPYEHRCMFAHGPHEARTAAMNIRDGLFTEEAIKSFKRAQRAAQREATDAARALARQQKLQQIASEEERERQRARPQGAPLPPPPSYDCALLNASSLNNNIMGRASNFCVVPVVQHAVTKGANGSSSSDSSENQSSNPVSSLNLNNGHAHRYYGPETTVDPQQSYVYEQQQHDGYSQQCGAEQYGDGSSLCGDEGEYAEEEEDLTNGSVPLRSFAYDPCLFLPAGHQHELNQVQAPTASAPAPPSVYRRNPYSIMSVYRPLAAGSSHTMNIKEVALVTDCLTNGLVMP